MNSLLKAYDLINNMGISYVIFRGWHFIKLKTKYIKRAFPVEPKSKSFVQFAEWKAQKPPFFFDKKSSVKLEKNEHPLLQERVDNIKVGKFTFFGKSIVNLGNDYDWITNPVTGYTFDIKRHWSEIADLSKEAGDIKYVWEKARFSFLYDLIRYDYHFDKDQSKIVFSEIEDFMDKNPINQGPNYKCSQEISLRILNWTFALYYYQQSDYLTEELFSKLINSIYWQLDHVYKNINFSRIAVRNNHAITETLMLYLSGLLFPFIPETKTWGKKGKEWFEKEIEYQIYDDGTFLQFSMNYHRVVVQLLTWGIRLSELHGDRFRESVYVKARKSLDFLETALDVQSGKLPNYGANDGALFFKLTDDDYRVYTSQLSDLRAVLDGEVYWPSESQAWYGLRNLKVKPFVQRQIVAFDTSGYYIHNEDTTKTFIRCGGYLNRPNQSDNLHLDIWHKGINYLWDVGSYKYNTDKALLDYFKGASGHNTVSVNGSDQMLKGSRFTWHHWIKEARAQVSLDKDRLNFEGTIAAFSFIRKDIKHNRKVWKSLGLLEWEVEDDLKNTEGLELTLYWQMNPSYENNIEMEVLDTQGAPIIPEREVKWYSGYYGLKEQSIRLAYRTMTSGFRTKIKISS